MTPKGQSMLKTLLSALAVLLPLASATAADRVEVIDLAGRRVSVPAKVERVILGEGRYVPVLAILDRDDPTKRVVGQMGDFQLLDPGTFAQYREHFPKLAEIPPVGRVSADSFSVAQAIALEPDVAIFGLEGHGPSPKAVETIAQLEAAGIAVVFIDFRRDPLKNTPRSVALLGTVLGRDAEAAAFTAFYEAELKRVTDRVASLAVRPSVFLESRVGLTDQCCETMVNGMMGRFVDEAGGRNAAAGLVPGETGTVNVEHLLTREPDVYIGTATGALATMDKTPNRIVLGAGVTPELARSSLERTTRRTGIADLAAVREKRAFAVWHHFYNSPFNVAAVQAFAAWLHPQVFADIDPQVTLRTLYARFQPVPLNGTYWVGLK